MDRSQKQGAVALLNDWGAFTLRKSVEDVAEALGVSRFTVYNYLERAEAGG
jgi:predicted transcriptional regulator YheO